MDLCLRMAADPKLSVPIVTHRTPTVKLYKYKVAVNNHHSYVRCRSKHDIILYSFNRYDMRLMINISNKSMIISLSNAEINFISEFDRAILTYNFARWREFPFQKRFDGEPLDRSILIVSQTVVIVRKHIPGERII